MSEKIQTKTPRERLETLPTISHWIAFSREEVREVMQETGGIITYCGNRYAISFRPARRALSHFVFENSSCKEEDYRVCLVNPNMVIPHREWD